MIAIKERFMKIKAMIAEYNEVGNKDIIDRASMITSPVTCKDIILLPFTANIKNEEQYEESDDSSPILRKIDERKSNAYLSTPRFIKYLTDISELISKETNKKEALKRELRKLNQHLPASVYIPFCQDSLRNYAVLHIPPEEVSVFQTKTRAPYMITIELYRPDEMSISSNAVGEQKIKSKISKTMRKNSRKESLDLSDYEEPLLVAEQTDDLFNMQRGKSNSVYMQTHSKIDLAADKKVSNPLFISFIGARQDARATLRETQLNQNKAEKIVKKFLLDSNDSKMIPEDNSSMPSGVDEEDEEEGKGEYNNLSNLERSFDEVQSEENNSPPKMQPLKNMKSKTGEPKLDSSRNNQSVNRSSSRKNSDTQNYHKNDLNDILSQRKEDEVSLFKDRRGRADTLTVKTPTNFLFKETLEQQSERLKKASIFGTLKTWKICKIIVKSGDDLRQEQFAMQLIDTMAQIFRVQEVG
jgi:hypothetical protein